MGSSCYNLQLQQIHGVNFEVDINKSVDKCHQMVSFDDIYQMIPFARVPMINTTNIAIFPYYYTVLRVFAGRLASIDGI